MKNNHYASWPSLTPEDFRKHCLDADETFYGTMSQSSKNKQSTAKRTVATSKKLIIEEPKKFTKLTSLLETLAHCALFNW